MSRHLAFEQFWNKAVTAANGSNSLCHHICCDVWTTRASKSTRATHIKKTSWRAIMESLSKKAPDKKAALLAKMTEEGWRLPVILNKPCEFHSHQSLGEGGSSKGDQPEESGQDLFRPTDPLHLPDNPLPPSPQRDPCTIYSKQAPLIHRTSLPKS